MRIRPRLSMERSVPAAPTVKAAAANEQDKDDDDCGGIRDYPSALGV
jgi:hypothetical protein